MAAAGIRSCWGTDGHQSATRQLEGPVQLGQPFTAEMLTQGGLSAQNIKFPLPNMITRTTRCFSRKNLACNTAVQAQTSTQLWFQLL